MTPYKVGSTYYVMWTCVPGHCPDHVQKPERHKVCLFTGDKREAKNLVRDLETKLADQRARYRLGLHAPLPSNWTLDEYRDKYFASTEYDKAPTTRATEQIHFATLARFFRRGDKPGVLADLTLDRLEAYKKARLGAIAPRSWNSELATLKSIFAWGLTRQPPLYTENPLAKLTRVPPGDPTIPKYVSPETIRQVVDATADPFWQCVIAFLYASFCRGSELRGLKWEHVYPDYFEFRYPKEKKPKRIPMTPVFRELFRRLRGMSYGEYVFSLNGAPLTKDALYKRLSKLGAKVGTKFSSHRVRHSSISTALNAGAPVFSVQAVAGHSQVSTTQGYSHVPAHAQAEALEATGADVLVFKPRNENATGAA